MGAAQLLASPFGVTATPNYPVTATAHSLGATRSLHLPAACALLPLLLLASGLRPVTALPAVALAAIVAHNGLDLLADTLSDAWVRLPPTHFSLVLLHVATTAAVGMAPAVLLGVLLTAALFVLEYSAHSGVLQTATSSLERSNVARPAEDARLLDAVGASALVVHLFGVLYFGSCASLVEVRRRGAAVQRFVCGSCPTLPSRVCRGC